MFQLRNYSLAEETLFAGNLNYFIHAGLGKNSQSGHTFPDLLLSISRNAAFRIVFCAIEPTDVPGRFQV